MTIMEALRSWLRTYPPLSAGRLAVDFLPKEARTYSVDSVPCKEEVRRYLDENRVPYLRGLVWTTDAIFRETPDRIARRKEEGAKIVEMEQAGCIAVAKVRGFAYGALIYGGDDLTGEEWSNRGWRSRRGVRCDLVILCKELVKII